GEVDAHGGSRLLCHHLRFPRHLETGRVRAAGPLTSPALLSRRTPFPRERRETTKEEICFCFFQPPLSRGKGVRWERGGRGSEGPDGADDATICEGGGIGESVNSP